MRMSLTLCSIQTARQQSFHSRKAVNMKLITPLLAGAALAAGALTTLPAQADEGPFMIRLRAVYLDFAQKSDAIPALGLPADQVEVNKKWIPDIDFEFFFTKHFSTELVLTYPQSQTVSVKGVGDIGTFKHLPPTLTAKWNFMPDSVFRPYVGLGVNYTIISDVALDEQAPAVPPLDLNSSSVGLAAQVGADFKFNDHWFGNLDVKWVQLGSDVKIKDTGDVVTKVHLDPWLLGVGIGYRF